MASGDAGAASRRYVAALDQGTTSTRCILFDETGEPRAISQKEHRQIFPGSAWVEHDPEEIWQRAQEVLRGALEHVGASAADVAALGITNQRETIVAWNRVTGKPYHNALVWQDQRGAPLCDRLANEVDPKTGEPCGRDRLREATGLPLVPYFSASKLAWLLENVPGLREDAEAGTALAGTIDSFLVWRLTGGTLHVTDVTNACRTLLLNIRTLEWDDALCSLFKVPKAMLPQVRPSSCVYGACCASSPLPGVPIAGILGDQQAALFGQAAFKPGDAKNTYGTGCFLLMNTGESLAASRAGLLTTVAYQLDGSKPVYALEGSVAVAGAVTTWLRDGLSLVASGAELTALAETVRDAGGVVFVPAFNGLFAPHWRSDARGVMLGLSGHVTRAHIARAALEGVAHQSRELLEAMAMDARTALKAGGVRSLKVDGGMTASGPLMQFQADITGLTVTRPVVAETTALGAAYAAGLAVRFWSSLEELESHWKAGQQWRPRMPAEAVAASVRDWERSVARALGWAPSAGMPSSEDPALQLLKPTPRPTGASSSSPGWKPQQSTQTAPAEAFHAAVRPSPAEPSSEGGSRPPAALAILAAAGAGMVFGWVAAHVLRSRVG